MIEELHCKFEEKIIQMAADVAVTKTVCENLDKRINGSMDSVKKHIEDGTKWRLGIVCSLIGVFGLFITRLVGLGHMEKQVEINTARLTHVEEKVEKHLIEVAERTSLHPR